MASSPAIAYTYTDEAPMLASHALLPIVKAFVSSARVDVQLKDISLSSRILGAFPDYLEEGQKVGDVLAELGELVRSGNANIVKLPSISASIPQLEGAIAELRGKGFAVPDYPEDPKDDAERDIKERYRSVLGSAVNSVLREGNSYRNADILVKEYASRFPHSMGKWSEDSRTHVSHMTGGDFYANEKSVCIEEACEARIELVAEADGSITVLKNELPLKAGEVLDGTFMSCKLLRAFLNKEIDYAKAEGVLFSVHLEATNMKVSDPILFGHCVKAYFKDVFEKHGAKFKKLGVDAKNGLDDICRKIRALPEEEQSAIEADIKAACENRAPIAMVDSSTGITNLHLPNGIVIGHSMANAIRCGGKMWDRENQEQDFKACIPDRCYASVFHECIEFCKENGAFDPKTMGACPNVGLMAHGAEEHGSHENTFEAKQDGTIRIVVNGTEKVLMGHKVERGDVWRACRTEDEAIRSWVALAVARLRQAKPVKDQPCKAIFWLNQNRAHDTVLMKKVQAYLRELEPIGLDIDIMSPAEATRRTCQRAKKGLSTLAITGSVLGDYLAGFFPTLELGVRGPGRMLSSVPLRAGGVLRETGTGGSAPKHAQQFQKEGHLRWDCLGVYLALAASLGELGRGGNQKAAVLSAALQKAVRGFLMTSDKAPAREAKKIDTRGSNYWMARLWAEELAAQFADRGLQKAFAELAQELAGNESKILEDLTKCQGEPMDLGGYYKVDKALADRAMNPSCTFNAIIERIGKVA